VLHADGRTTGVELQDVASFFLDEERRPQIEVVAGSQHGVEADTVIFAVGQRPDVPPGFGLATGAGSCLPADPFTFSTGREGVFAAGDAVTGTSSVIEAIAAGRKAAAAIDRFLGGSGYFEVKPPALAVTSKAPGLERDFAARERRGTPFACPPDLKDNYDAVVGDMDEDTAAYESGRCLQCDLRLKITRVKFWGDY
jgi:formate dehydrogenase beta subunit